MKKLVVISGKGGTGKTTITSSLAYLSNGKRIADCDVEAPNLNLLLNNKIIDEKLYVGGSIAKVDESLCIDCGKCREYCRFDAISKEILIDPLKCEGCGTCKYICPKDAIKMEDEETGYIYTSEIEKGNFVYAKLNIGADAAGKVVTEIRKEIDNYSNENDLIIIDGAPGVGCVVIASITNCDMAVIVTEPTQSGLSDLKRIFSLVKQFNIKPYVVINKYDINKDMTREIKNYCKEEGIKNIKKVPFDSVVNKSLKENKTIVEYSDSKACKSIKDIWVDINKKMGGNNYENSNS
ncbi:MAG: (4Fe-4S)-binding protein [Firmicutes bacterium]|nr:(4Fe-4S)-binding protein [Bacillota bacterium]